MKSRIIESYVDKSDPKNIDTGVSNLFLKGAGYDTNGNMRIIVGFPNDKGVSIQTNGTLPETDSLIRKVGGNKARLDRLSDDEIVSIGNEVTDYIQKYGSADMKKRLRVYGSDKTEPPVSEGVKRRRVTEEIMTKEEYYMDKHYLVTGLWASSDESDDSGGEPLDTNYDIDDIAEDSQQAAAADCKKFRDQVKAAGLMDAYLEAYDNDEKNAYEMMGHNFWLTRNGHGAGFWDATELSYRDDDLGKKLSDIADKFGESYMYVGDDGQIHIQ